MDNYIAISETFAGMKNYKDAYEYYKKYSDLNDSILNEEGAQQKNKAEIEMYFIKTD